MATVLRIGAFILLCAAVVAGQYAYDISAVGVRSAPQLPSAETVKRFDLGLHSAAASFLWIGIRSELPFLSRGPAYFLSGLQLVNDLDPRWSTPYAFTVLVLPNIPWYQGRVSQALAVGERGLASADPNWQIPFYMGAIYQLELKDHANAARYFDAAAATPGVPELIRRFAVNYGIHPDSLEATLEAWAIIREISPDPAVRARAAAHIAHLEILQQLNLAVQAFFQKEGRYPVGLEELMRVGLLTGTPEDPFGFQFKVYEGGRVGIAP